MELSGADVRGKLFRFNQWLAELSMTLQLGLALLLLVVCALVDYYTGSELSFSIGYLAPIAVAAWYAGRAAGYAMAVVASLVWLSVDLFSGHLTSHPLIPFWNGLVRFGFFLIVTALLLQIRNLLELLQEQATTDSLTGLANSRSFYDRLELERERSRRYRHPFTLAYLDLDNFKQVNDTWGRKAGDWVLQTIATCLTSTLRRTDLVARLGGDEFAVLLAETGEPDGREALHKLHDKLAAKMAEQDWPISCSIGAITCEDPPEIPMQDLIHRADELMYQVKRSGKGRIELIEACPTEA